MIYICMLKEILLVTNISEFIQLLYYCGEDKLKQALVKNYKIFLN